MAHIQILGSHESHDGMYIKEIDKKNAKLTFTKKVEEAYYRSSGFYAESERDFVKYHFKKEYPFVAYARVID